MDYKWRVEDVNCLDKLLSLARDPSFDRVAVDFGESSLGNPFIIFADKEGMQEHRDLDFRLIPDKNSTAWIYEVGLRLRRVHDFNNEALEAKGYARLTYMKAQEAPR